MAQLRSAIEVISTFSLLNLPLDLLDLFAQLTDLANGLLFSFPLRPHSTALFLEISQLLPQMFESFLTGLILLLGEGCLFNFQLHHAPSHFVQLGWHGIDLCPNHSTCLIHQVNSLVR